MRERYAVLVGEKVVKHIFHKSKHERKSINGAYPG